MTTVAERDLPMALGRMRLACGQTLYMMWMDIPMHQDVAMVVQSVLDEAIGGGKVLEEILLVLVVDVNLKMLVWLYELFVNGPAEDGDDVCDVGLCDGLFAAQGEQAGTGIESGDGGCEWQGLLATYPPM